MPKLVMKMPDLATTDSAIKVIRWLVAPGESVARGQALLEVETDKATMEVESIATGRLVTHHAQPGDALIAGQPLAALEIEGPARPVAPSPAAEPVTPPPAAAVTLTPTPAAVSPAAPKAGGMFARNRSAQQNKPPSKP